MSNPGNKQASVSTEAGRKRQRNSSVASTSKVSKQRKITAAVASASQQASSSEQQQEQQQSEEALDDAASSRRLRDLTDFFPETAPPQGRRLTRSLARSLNASSSASSQSTKSRASEDSTVSTQQQQSAGASGGPQQSPGVSSQSAAHSVDDAAQPSSSSSAAAAGAAGGSRGNKGPSKKAKAVGKKRLTSSNSKQESSSGSAAAGSSSRSRRSSVNQADAATANTGICQSIGRSDGNRVFPEQQQQQQHHQQLSEQQLQLQRAADEAALEQAHFVMAASAGLAQVEHPQRTVGRTPASTAASNLFGTLMPRMQHLLGGAHAQQNVRVAAIMDGLRSSNEIRQSEAATELAEMLLLGNEESLPNLPVKELVQALMVLLQKEHNFELMLTAARCLTNLLEALPRALPIVLDTVPLLLEKLKRIECIDVAEQALTALEVLSRRNGKTIMSAGGIAATISHVDFFSVPSQRLAFQIAANCAMFVTANDFAQVRDSLPELTQRLLVEDKRCLESVCAVFARLVDNLRGHPDKLREIVGPNHGLLTNVQQLLLIQPPAVGSTTFQSLIRMLRYMCAKCSDLAVALVEMGFARTLRFLIIGTEKADAVDFELLNRPPQQLQELVFLAGELLPRLPVDGLFEVDTVMSKSQAAALLDMPTAQWLWKDDNNVWQLYSSFDSRLLEIAFQSHEREVQLQMVGQVYRVDIERFVQINEMTGNARQVQRRATSVNSKGQKQQGKEVDKRAEMLKSNRKLSDDVVRLLFPILVEIDGSSSGPAIRYESLRVMLRMVYPSSPKLLQEVLDQLPLAGHIASALASPRSKDLCIVASALQLVHLVTEKLPHIYGSLFRRQGVAHQVEKLANLQMEATPQPSPHVPAKTALSAEHIPSLTAQQQQQQQMHQLLHAPLTRSGHKHHRLQHDQSAAEDGSTVAQKALRMGASAARNPPVYGSHTPQHHLPSEHLPFEHADQSHPLSADKEPHTHSSVAASSPFHLPPSVDAPTHSSKKEAKKKTSAAPFFQSLRLPSWRLPGSASWATASGGGPSTPSSASPSGGLTLPTVPAPTQPGTSAARGVLPPPAHHYVGLPAGMRPLPPYGAPLNDAGALSQQQKDKLRAWIKKEAQYLMATFFRNPDANGNEDSPIGKMAEFGQALALIGEDVGSKPLTELKHIFTHNDISAFELNHSGLIEALATYLTSEALEPARNLRLKRFAAVFMGLTPDNLRPSAVDHPWSPFEMLVSKLLAAVAQLEQFHVKVTDMGVLASGGGPVGSLRGASALRFFQTHQIRCALRRHPSCKELREWRRGQGSIKVDPFTSISAIERYLLDRGVGFPRAQGNDDSSGDDDATSDDDEVEGGAEGGALAAAGQQQRRIEIVINDQKVPSHMSILQAIRQYSIPPTISADMDHVALAAGIWVNTHTLWYRSATDDEAQDSSRDTTENSSTSSKSGKKASVSKEKKHKIDEKLWNEGRIPERHTLLEQYLTGRLPTDLEDPSVPALTLLRALYGLNRYWWALFADEDVPPSSHAPLLPPTAFHSNKLAAKIARQLSDFLTVATQQIPKWINDLVWAAPFVVPFPVRRNLLYCTAFGRDRALMHLVNQTEGGQTDGDTGRLTPRLERRKVSIRREDLLRHAEEAMQQLGSSRAMLEVGFDGEAGTGFGPTLEFYSTVSKELQRFALKLWHGEHITLPAEHAGGQPVEYVLPGSGLYPMAISNGMNSKQREARAKKFEFIGRLMAQALIDARMLDLPLNPVFFKWLLCEEKTLGLPDLEMLDPNMYQILKRLTDTADADFENMEMYFTLPGDESFELVKGGKDKAVDKSNARHYAELVAYWRLHEGTRRDMEAVRRGLESIIDLKQLTLFTPEEMDELFCGSTEESKAGSGAWERGTLQQALKPDHGYSHESQQIKWLVDMLAAYSTDHQRKFLQFVTGSPKLPVGGFKSLNPALTVVKKSGTYGNVDEELPSAMTCYNYLKIPAYSSYQVFVERFELALRFIYSFHLT